MTKMAFPTEVIDNSTVKLQQLAAEVKNSTLKKADLPSKY